MLEKINVGKLQQTYSAKLSDAVYIAKCVVPCKLCKNELRTV